MSKSTRDGKADQALQDAVADLVGAHGIPAVVGALAAFARWRAHHLRSIHGPRRLAEDWERAGTTLSWAAEITLAPLDRDGRTQGGAL
jgi:hypothetical protein